MLTSSLVFLTFLLAHGLAIDPGDLAIVGLDTEGGLSADFALVVLRPGGLPRGQKLYVTDRGVTNECNLNVASWEGTLEYTAPNDLPQGTIITYQSDRDDFVDVEPSTGEADGKFWLWANGDNLAVYTTDSDYTGTPHFVFAVSATGWSSAPDLSTSFKTSAVPCTLQVGATALGGMGSTYQNIRFVQTGSCHGRVGCLDAIANADNWVGSNMKSSYTPISSLAMVTDPAFAPPSQSPPSQSPCPDGYLYESENPHNVGGQSARQLMYPSCKCIQECADACSSWSECAIFEFNSDGSELWKCYTYEVKSGYSVNSILGGEQIDGWTTCTKVQPPASPAPPALPPPLSPPSPAVLELTGEAPKILFGPAENPICSIKLDRGAGNLVSSCPISEPGRRRLDEPEDTRVTQVELAELKTEVADLLRQVRSLAATK